MTQLLIADDDSKIRSAVRLALMGEDYSILEADSLAAVEDTLRRESVDLMLLDVHFQNNETSLPLVERLAKANLLPPTVILSGAASAKQAADGIRFGAYDYIEKPPTADRLRSVLARCLDHARLARAYQRITSATSRIHEMIGDSTDMRQIKRLVELYGPKDVKVLITGETGTGKEEVAHALAKISPRSTKPMILVNCAAIPDNLVESELFGHRKGSFTGATHDQLGKIELADGGTLFLDEIGELTLSAQVKLLRFLETGEVQAVGSTKLKRCDVRLLAATSRNLELEVAKGRFREDLFYRLNVARIEMPPLRVRGDDVLLLFRHFVAQLCRKYGEPTKAISKDAIAALRSHDWPGNVRELRNAAERAVINASDIIEAHDLPRPTRIQTPEETATNRFNRAGLDCVLGDEVSETLMPMKEFKRRLEAAYIAHALTVTKGSVAKAAELLKLDRSHLHQKLVLLGLRTSKE